MERNVSLEKKIEAYISGHLSEEESQQLWEELLKRPDYIELLNTELAARTIHRTNRISAQNEQKDQHTLVYQKLQIWKWVGIAAAIILLVVSINYFKNTSSPTADSLAIKNINLSENLISPSVLRSSEQQITPADSMLNLAYGAAIRGKLSEAVPFYDHIISRYPNQSVAVKALLNKGIILFNKGKFDKAKISFEKVIQKSESNSFNKEKGYWFLGNTYINSDQPDSARQALLKAKQMNGIYYGPSNDILEKMDQQLGQPAQNNK